ncbi:unnamed protein product [Rhizoctonia solani]|uniref:Peptidase C14 caspase domain-containing protein n=1 Tax=Rhizoctonia solani TaxID=456999 RepID=A0A8H3GSG2_9AGAM|nr:unnamed protein product [Rhizoctonia solani]
MGPICAISQMIPGRLIRPRLTRGLTSCVIDAGSAAPNDSAHSDPSTTSIFRNNSHVNKRGKSLGVHSSGLSNYVGHIFEAESQPVLTEEPSSMTDTGETVGRGRQGSVEVSAQSSSFNAVQARACRQPVPKVSETLKSAIPSQLAAETEVEIEKDASHSALHEEPDGESSIHRPKTYPKSPLAAMHNPSFSRKPFPWRVGTDPAPISLLARDTAARKSVRPHPFRTTSTHSPNEATFHPTFGSPLQASLFTGSRIPPTLYMLVIAVAYDKLEDPQHDFDLIQSWLKDYKSGRIHFQGVSGKEATRERIEEAIRELYSEALHSHGSKLLILLTGEGDNINRMHLMGERFITDTDIRNWLWRLRNEARPNVVPTIVVLDYCRTNQHIPLGAMQGGIEFIWSCSLGQKAAALKFKTLEGIPRSCFLLALMMASYNPAHTKGDLSAAVNRKLDQLSRLLELAKKHKGDHSEELQQVDWGQARHMQPIHDLASMLSRMDVVPKVYRVLMSNKWFREANGLPVNWVLKNKLGRLGETGKFKYKRGTCKPVHVCWIPVDRPTKRS